MVKLFNRAALHEHAEPAQRILGAAELSPDSGELARLLTADPAPEVRIAAAQRCTDLRILASAWQAESDAAVRAALASALVTAIADTADSAAAQTLLESDPCTDTMRASIASSTQNADRRRAAISAMQDENALIELALTGGRADTRIAAAERVQSPEALRRLADAAKNKDHGVARLARQRIDAMMNRQDQAAEADAILAQLEGLATRPGPILTAVVELNRRWQALDISGDAERLARCDTARQTIQARFDREHEEQRTRARFERKLREWIEALELPIDTDALPNVRAELAALRDEAKQYDASNALSRLEQAAERIARLEQERQALADAEALVIEAEQLALGTSIDDAKLPERWQALDRSIRTPALTRRFEAALIVVEQRRLAQVHAAEQEVSAVRQRVHGLLHAAEQALAAGQVQPARTAADEIRTLKPGAGLLPKPTLQRLSRVTQQLVELERWESFGQHNARVQLCERAEALPAQAADVAQIAADVQKLRNEWKALDQQNAGVPKALWERFDRACEKAYAPAAKHFAELAARRKEARKHREDFIAAAAAHAPTLLTETPDWRAIERWLRDAEQRWREGDLGSVEPGAWKKFDLRFKAAVAPLRDALSDARNRARDGRRALIEEAKGLVAKAMDRDTPSQVKAIQSRWQEQAKTLPLAQRDERALWDEFRAACDAVFGARQSKRKEEDGRKTENRRALDEICTQFEQLAHSTDPDDQGIRRTSRDLQEQWKKKTAGSDAVPHGVESRFRSAKAAVETLLSSRVRSREAAVWRTLAAKERLCEELDSMVRSNEGTGPAGARNTAADEQWAALPALPSSWETKMAARRDAAQNALRDAAAGSEHLGCIERGTSARREGLIELEMLLGLDSPSELQAARLAMQVKQLRDRFQGGATSPAGSVGERLVAWCAEPGIVESRDRKRAERVFAAIEKAPR